MEVNEKKRVDERELRIVLFPLVLFAPTDCTEGFRKGLFQGKGVYMIHPILAKDPFPVYCKDMSNVRTYIMDRRKNDISFNRNFSDYQAGFGGVDGDHWLGLDKVRLGI